MFTWQGQLSQHSQASLTVSSVWRLTEDDEDIARLHAVGGGEKMSVSEETAATAQVGLAGGVSDDDQGSPGELIGSSLLTSPHSHLDTAGALLSLSTLTPGLGGLGTARAGDQPEK